MDSKDGRQVEDVAADLRAAEAADSSVLEPATNFEEVFDEAVVAVAVAADRCQDVERDRLVAGQAVELQGACF